MRTFTAIALIACLALSQAATVTITPFDTTATCTAGTPVSAGVTVNKLQVVSAALTVDTCTQIGATGKYVKISGTSAAPTAFKSYPTSTCDSAGTVVITTLPTTVVASSTGPCIAVASTNTDAYITSMTSSVKVTGSTTSLTVTAFADGTCGTTTAASATNSNNFFASTALTAVPGACTASTSTTVFYFKITLNTDSSIASFKTYGSDTLCAAGNAVIDTTTTPYAWATCQAVKTTNTDVAVTSTAPYVKLAYAAGSSAANLSVCIAAFFALLVAALF